MKDKTILVTGATDGIGRQTALELAQRGAHVLLHGRNPKRAPAVLAELRHRTGNERLEYLNADFAALAEVRALAEAVLARYDRLDALINNAGVFMPQRQLSRDGLELTFAVNHLAPFLLTNSLLPRLKRSAPARIVIVSSTTHQGEHLDFDDLQSEQRYDGYTAYARSKLANVLFTYALAERLKGTGVTANALHPGAVSTKLLHAGWGAGGASVAAGAATPVYLATAPEVEGVTGRYFANQRPTRSAPATYDRALQERLWAASEALVQGALAASGTH